jgi:DNA-binding response OmpR family regulator
MTGLRVLGVEDDHRIAAMIANGLQASDHVAEVVSTGAAALERLASGAADVMLLDLGLPDIDGLDVLRRQAAEGARGGFEQSFAARDLRNRPQLILHLDDD